MDRVNANQDGKFTRILKRIWNGPEEEEFLEDDEITASGTFMARRAEAQADRGRAPIAQRGEDPALREGGRGRSVPPQYPPVGGRELQPSSRDTTVISKGTSITGDIRSDGDIEMHGTVMGNIVTKGNVTANGRQVGNVQGAKIDLSSCTVKGNLSASDDISIDSESVVVGDIKSGNLTMDGKLQGNIHVMGSVNCRENAVVLGDITSTTIVVSSGAKLQGKLQISDGSIEQIRIPEEEKKEQNEPAKREEQPSDRED